MRISASLWTDYESAAASFSRRRVDAVYFALGVVLFLLTAGAGVLLVNRPRLILVAAEPPDDFPAQGFSHRYFEALLRRYVDAAGRVDYQRWHGHTADRASLDAYLAAVARFSPENAPQRFAEAGEALAYWLYAYNGYVIKSVLDRWPLESVTAVKAPLEPVKGFGFFYRLRFLFGGRAYSLYAVENRKIRRDFQDARVHFLLNCGSQSCPAMRPQLPVGAALEELLRGAALEFVQDPRNVSVDYPNRQIRLSAIFQWYRKDFINDLRRRGLPSERGLLDYLTSVAPEGLRKKLDGAADFALVFNDYDWSVNRTDS